MGKRKVTILESAVEAVARVAFYIESEGLPETAKSLLTMYLNFSRNYLMNK